MINIDTKRRGGDRLSIDKVTLEPNAILDMSALVSREFLSRVKFKLEDLGIKVEFNYGGSIVIRHAIPTEADKSAEHAYICNFYPLDAEIKTDEEFLDVKYLLLTNDITYQSKLDKLIDIQVALFIKEVQELGESDVQAYFGPADTIEANIVVALPLYTWIVSDKEGNPHIETESTYLVAPTDKPKLNY